MTPDLYAFFHVWADGAWQEPVADFLGSVNDSGLNDVLRGKYLGLVGTRENRLRARQDFPGWDVIASADSGFTQVTLTALRDFALEEPARDGYVVYAHNKGAMNNTDFNAAWRRSMFRRVIEDWRTVVPLLENHDAAGCHWLTRDRFPHMSFTEGLPAPRHFGGEVYWARLDYIRTLPPLRTETRWDSEPWIAENPSMRHYDLLPGWPDWSLFR